VRCCCSSPATFCILLLAFAAAPRLVAAQGTRGEIKGNIHTVFLTDCTAYADWQSIAMAFSWRQAEQPGPLTRVMSCTDQEAKQHPKQLLADITTHIAPSLSKHPRTGDHYVAYNKPAAVADWLRHFTPEEEWVLLLEADMVLRAPFLPEDLNLTKPGWAIGGRFEQLKGVANALAGNHIPEVPPRGDALAGPAGRRADQVGWFMVVHRDDLKRMAPFWLKYTEAVRADPQVGR